MKHIPTTFILPIMLALLAVPAALQAGPITAFTYQGRLNNSTNTATGLYDFRAMLFDDPEAGSMVAERVDMTAVGVTNGLFTLSLDFGANVFDGTPLWLAMGVRTNGSSAFTPLLPRKALTPTPNALFSLNADQAAVATTVPSGAITSAKLADGAVTSTKIASSAVKSSHIDDGGSAAYGSFLDIAGALGNTEPLPFSALALVTTNGAAPSFVFTLDGASFGTVAGFVGHEAMSEPYEFVVEVIAPSASLDPAAQIGRQGRVTFARNGRSSSFAGVVTGCSASSYDATSARYTFRLESPLACLALWSDYRFYQNCTVPDLVSSLYDSVTSNTVSRSLTGSYAVHETVTQFGETDLNFFSRLLEDEGIFYFFNPSGTPPTLILGDYSGAYIAAPNSPFSYYGDTATNAPLGAEYIRTFQKANRESVKTFTIARNYDYTKARPNGLLTERKNSTVGRGEMYSISPYSDKAVVEEQAAMQVDRQVAEHFTSFGTGNAPDLRAGCTFTLTDQTGAGLGGSYLVTSVHHSAFRRLTNGVATLYYGNEFEVIPASIQYRPARKTPKPTAQPYGAVVVGPAGDEIYTDKFGRVKVQFNWDRYGTNSEHSSAWIRVASPWVGKQWGAIFIPRIGQEVMVNFIQGDPDQPVITGSFYNADNMPPYALPDNKTQSGIKTRSSPGGTYANFNEVRFEDKKGAEELYIHAEKDLTLEVENDTTAWVGHDLTLSVSHNLDITAGNTFTITSAQGVGINAVNDVAFGLNVGGGGINATAYHGDGSGLINLSASALVGTISDVLLSANVPRLNGAQRFTGINTFGGINTFTGTVTFSNTVQSFGSGGVRMNDTDLYFRPGTDTLHGLGWYGGSKLFGGVNLNGPALYGNGGGALGVIGSTTNMALRWDSSQGVTIYGTLFMGSNIRMSDRDLLLRSDLNHGLGWYGSGKPFGTNTPDGPVLYGYSGGGLGTLQSGTATNLAVYWNSAGNVGIGTNSPNQKLVVAGNIYATGTITPNSDRTLKTDFQTVDAASVLDRVAQLSIQQWRFQSEPEGVRHVGPMAQDFRAAFGLGEIPTAIATVDADGVALAAIQALNQKLNEKDAEIQALKQSVAELKEALTRLTQSSK